MLGELEQFRVAAKATQAEVYEEAFALQAELERLQVPPALDSSAAVAWALHILHSR